MTINTLSLPIDIPWKRLCVSDDMIDRNVCDAEYPPKWRSSIAAFYYEPDADNQTFEDRIITYVKIVCTITNFSPSSRELGLTPERLGSYWSDPERIEDLSEFETFPCYGALLQVLLGPPADVTSNPADYPFFMDFEPKKREVYEIATEAKERTSRSLSNLNVRKGTTTTETHEELDIDTGGSGGFSFAGFGLSGGVSGQWGTRDITEQERANIRTTDDAREKRETYSFTTQLTQMYHQFISYHLGTNRAVFFILPRPRTITNDLTFVDGPIQIQGIQEVFLVVNRPKTMNSFCLEAHLETAHLVTEAEFETLTSETFWTYENRARAVNNDRTNNKDNITVSVPLVDYFEVPSGWKIDRTRGTGVAPDGSHPFGSGYVNPGGFDIIERWQEQRFEAATITVTDRRIEVWSRVTWAFWETGWLNNDHMEDGFFLLPLRIYLISEEPQIVSEVTDLWLTGRGLCCGSGCTPPILKVPSDYVPYEKIPIGPFDPFGSRKPRIYTGKATAKAIFEDNRLIRAIGDAMVQSIGSMKRYPYGKVNFYETEFFANRIARRIQENHPDNMTISKVPGVDPTIRDKVIGRAGDIGRKQLLSLPLKEIAAKFGITEDEGRYLRAAVIGFPVEPPSM